MTDQGGASTEPFFRCQKGFEGKAPFYCWTVSFKYEGQFRKAFLIADVEQKTFGCRLRAEKPENLHPSGGVVAQIRKHAKTSIVGRIISHKETGDLWLAIHSSGESLGGCPEYWLHLKQAHPPEMHFMDRDGTIHIRRSSQGTFTKKRPFEGVLPPDTDDTSWRSINTSLVADFAKEFLQSEDTAPDDEEEPELQDDTTVLPEYQREARDRLARRLKTVRKALAKQQSVEHLRTKLLSKEQEADLLKSWIHLVKDGDHELSLAFLGEVVTDIKAITLDPDLSPGANLEQYYQEVKKLKKAIEVTKQLEKSQNRDFQSLTLDLERIRGGELSLHDVETILERNQLKPKKQEDRPHKTAHGTHQPWRTFQFQENGKTIRFFIGKSAADNDELCKKAKSNDYWMHAVGVTGSHVIIPAKEAGPSPTPSLIRTAGILALHFSKLRTDLRGEVYLSKRQHIRKQKGMPPGLWTVDKADSIFVSYNDEDLKVALSLVEQGSH